MAVPVLQFDAQYVATMLNKDCLACPLLTMYIHISTLRLSVGPTSCSLSMCIVQRCQEGIEGCVVLTCVLNSQRNGYRGQVSITGHIDDNYYKVV